MIMVWDGLWPWVAFVAFVLVMLALDLWVFHRKPHEIKIQEAVGWSVLWITLALMFNAGVYWVQGRTPALEFLTAYLVEKSLSVDNLFVFLLMFRYFAIPPRYQHEVLFWGIVGALILRALFIAAGVALIHRFHWVTYLFGAILLISGARFAFEKDKEVHPERNPLVRIFRRFMPVAADVADHRFMVTRDGKVFATRLLVVLVAIETTDLIFAVDSIPAVLAISHDPFIVFTSNIFAILGLRALYFALAGIMDLFHHLHYGLAAILVFVGGKMVLSDVVHVPVALSLGVVATCLVAAIAASMIWKKAEHA